MRERRQLVRKWCSSSPRVVAGIGVRMNDHLGPRINERQGAFRAPEVRRGMYSFVASCALAHLIASQAVDAPAADVPVDSSPSAASTATDNVTIERLVTVATDRFKRLKAFDASYVVRLQITTHGNRAGTKLQVQRFRVLSDFSRSRFRTEIQGDEARHEDLGWDGNLATRIWPEEMRGSIESSKNPPKDLFRFDQLLTLALLRPPAMDGNGADDGSLVSILQHGEMRKGKDLILNRPCKVVDSSASSKTNKKVLYATVWIDVERDALPLKVVLYGHDGKAARTAEVQESAQFVGSDGNSLWIPTKLTVNSKFGSARCRTENYRRHQTVQPQSTIERRDVLGRVSTGHARQRSDRESRLPSSGAGSRDSSFRRSGWLARTHKRRRFARDRLLAFVAAATTARSLTDADYNPILDTRPELVALDCALSPRRFGRACGRRDFL